MVRFAQRRLAEQCRKIGSKEAGTGDWYWSVPGRRMDQSVLQQHCDDPTLTRGAWLTGTTTRTMAPLVEKIRTLLSLLIVILISSGL
jgi:hypothetical protein